MGLREKVTIILVIIALIQIACRHCMPRTPRKASLKRYQNDLKPVKNNTVPIPYSPSRINKTPKQTFGKAAQNGRITQNSLPKKSLYKKYNFPENEYPLDNSPRDPFHIGMNFNENNNVNTLQKARNLQSSAISDLKKEMKMKRKLLSNKQVNYGNSQLKTDMSSIKSVSYPDPTRLLDSETFPEVQYPLNTMDTWGPNYWNYSPFTQEKPFHKLGQQTFNPTAKEDINKPLTRLTKAKASKYLQSYDKLKEEHRRTSTENSKRSNVGQKGLNFTKTATCEKVSDDFITAGLVSNIPSNSTEMKEASSAEIATSSENTCPITEYPYHPMPIPYKVIEENTENMCPGHEPKNNTKELQDVDNSVIAQTLQLIQEILFDDDDDTSSTVSTGNFSKEIEKNMNTSDNTVVSENKDISITLNDNAKSCTVSPTEELSQAVSDDAPAGNLRNNMTSLPAELIPENITTVAGPLNVRMPIPFSEPLTYEALTNALNPGPTPLSNDSAVPGSTSVIIIPFNNNAVGKSQMFGTSPDTPIIVYLPSTQSSDKPSQPWPFNQIVSSSIDRPMPNNQLYNVLSNMAPLQNDNPFSTAPVSELLNSNSGSGSSLPIHETLPTNSMCYNNESSPSSMKEKPISDILIHKSLTDDVPFVITNSDEKLSEQPTGTGDLDVNTDSLPPISDSEHPLFDFSNSDFTSLGQGAYNNILHDELPIIAREIDSDQQILNVSSKDLFIPTQNVTSEHLHKTTSMDSVSEHSLSEIPNDVPPVALDKNFSSVTPINRNKHNRTKTNRLLPKSIPNLLEPGETLTESIPQPIDKILLSTPLIEPPTAELPQPKKSSLSPTLLSETLSDKLPIIMDTKLPLTPVSDTTTDSAPQHISNSPSPPILNSSPMMTDMTLKTELYKMRQILDKMLSTETPTYSQPPPIDTTLLPISESDSLLLPINETPTESLPLPATDSPIDSLQQLHEKLPLISVDRTPTDTLPLSGNKVIPNIFLETETPLLPIDETVPSTPVSEYFADNEPYVLDNLVTPLSETVTSRTKDKPGNGLSHKIDDLPLKMDLKFPNIYEVSRNDLPLSVDYLPTKVHPEDTTNSGGSMNYLPKQVGETLTPVSKVPVSDLLKPTNVLSLPVDEVLKGASPDIPTNSVKTLMSGSIDQLRQDFSYSKIPSDGLPTLPVNVFKLLLHETFPDDLFNKISSEGPPQNDHLPQSVQKLSPVLSLADALINEPPLKVYSPSLVFDKNIEFPYSTADTKDLPLVVEHLLPAENDVIAESLVADIPSTVSLSTNLEGQQSTNLDKTSDEVLSDSILPDLARHYLPLPEEKTLPLTDNKPNDLSLSINETPLTSKLTITKAIMENVLSDITKGGLSSVVAKSPPVTPHSLLDKTLHHVDDKSPIAETKDIPLRPVELIFPNSEHTDNLIEYDPFSIKLEDTSITDLPSELSLPMDEMHKDKPYIPTDDIEDHKKNETQSLDNPTHDLLVPIDKVSLVKDPTETLSSSKLLITKALLEHILSDIITRRFSVPIVQSLPVTSHSVLDKTLYYVESPISHITEDSPSLPVDEIVPNTSLSDNPTVNLPISTEDTLPLPIDKTYSELQILNIPTKLPSPIDNIPNNSMYDKEQNERENPSSENHTDDLSSATPMEAILSLSKDTPSDLTLPNNKTQSSSKQPITKVLLENVLSDINTRGFSLPVAKALPVASRSYLDKTLYFLDTPVSDMTEKSSIIPTDNFPLCRINENVTPRTTDKTLPDNPILDIPIDEILMDKIHYSDIVTSNVEQEDRLDILTDDVENRDISDNMTDKAEDDDDEDKSDNLTYGVEDRDIFDIVTGAVEIRDTSDNLTDDVEDDNEDKSDIRFDDVEANDKSDNLTDDVEDRDIFDIVTDKVGDRATSDNLTNDVEDDNEDKSDNLTDDVEDRDIFDIVTGDAELEDKSDNLTDDVEDRDIFNIVTGDVELEDKSDILTDDVENRDKSDNMTDKVGDRATSDNLTNDVEDDNEDKSDNLTDDVEDRDIFDIVTGDAELEDKSDNLTDDVEDRDIFNIVTGDVELEDKSDILTDDVEDRDKSDNMTDKVGDRATSDNLTNDVEDDNEDKSDNLTDDVEDRDIFDIVTGDAELEDNDNEDKFDIWSDDVEANDKSDNLTDDVEDRDIFENLTDAIEDEKKSGKFSDDVEDRDKYDNTTDNVKDRDTSDNLTDDVKDDSVDKFDIWSDDVEANDKSDNTTDKVKDRDTSDNLTDHVKDDSLDKFDIWSDDVEANDKSDNVTDNVEDRDIFDIVIGDVELDDKSDILTDDVEDKDKSDNMTDKIEDRDTSKNLTDDVEDDNEDKFDIWSDAVEANDKSDNLTDEVEANDKSDNLTDEVEDRDIFAYLTDDVEIEDSNESLFSDDPIDGIPSDLPLPRTKPYLT